MRVLEAFRPCQKSDADQTFSYSTENTYDDWIYPFIIFFKKRNAKAMVEEAIGKFLTCLSGSKKVSASTQNQALNARFFLFTMVLRGQWMIFP